MSRLDSPIDATRSFSQQIKRVTNIAPFKLKIYSDATYTYVCRANPGKGLSTAGWQVERFDSDGSCLMADGDLKFDNLATDLATVQGLSYS